MIMDTIINTTISILNEAEKRNVIIRVCGSYGIYLVCNSLQNIENEKLSSESNTNHFIDGWRKPRDIDFVALVQDNEAIKHIFKSLGFKESRLLSNPSASLRDIFSNNELKIDISYNILDFNHRIDLRLKNNLFDKYETDINKIRLLVEKKTIPKTELLLQKLQIVFPGRKDLVDAWWLLKENSIKSNNDAHIDDGINTPLIKYYLERDWGFYYTIIQNLNRIEELSAVSLSSDGVNNDVISKIILLKRIIEDHPKGLTWNFRSKIGIKVRWYSDVEEVREL